jgi:hypothetical protein
MPSSASASARGPASKKSIASSSEPKKGDTVKRKQTNTKRKQTYPDTETRLRKASERLGEDNPKCAHCPESDPLALERHHVAGKQYGNATIVECRNCHRKLSDAQKDHPPRINDQPPTTFERIGHRLLGLADLLRLAAAKLDEVGRALIQYAADMAAKCTPAVGVAS